MYTYIDTQSCRGPWRKMRECGTKRILTDASQCRLRFGTTTIRNRCSRSPSRLPRYHHGTTWRNIVCCRCSVVTTIKKLLTDYSMYSIPRRDQSGGRGKNVRGTGISFSIKYYNRYIKQRSCAYVLPKRVNCRSILYAFRVPSLSTRLNKYRKTQNSTVLRAVLSIHNDYCKLRKRYMCVCFSQLPDVEKVFAGLSAVAVPSLQTVVLNRLLCMTFESGNDLRKSRKNANYRVKK